MKYAVAAVVMFCLLWSFAAAQPENAPLFFIREGDLYSYRVGDDEPFRETYWGYNQSPRVSPDGTMLVYNSYPERLIELDAAGVFLINEDQMPPTNLWLMEIATRTFTPIAQQPAPVGDGANFVRRTPATWSPDSRQLAWLEWYVNERQYSESGESRGLFLVTYDLASGTRSESPYNLPGIVGDAGMLGVSNTLKWGAQLASSAFTFGTEIGDFPLPELGGPFITLMLLDENQIEDVRVLENLNFGSPYIRHWEWVQYQNQWYLALLHEDGWYLQDVAKDQYYRIDSAPTLRAQSGQGMMLRPDPETFNWDVIVSSGVEASVRLNPNHYAISPDGETLLAVSFSDEGSYVIYLNDGQWEPYEPLAGVFGIRSLVWSPLIWQVEDMPEPSSAPAPMPTQSPIRG